MRTFSRAVVITALSLCASVVLVSVSHVMTGCSSFGGETRSTGETVDASPPPSSSDSAPGDAGEAFDAGPGDASCVYPPTAVAPATTFLAPRGTITVDGTLTAAEWGCVPFHRLDTANAQQQQYGDSGAFVELGAVWDDDALVFAARVRNDPTPRSGNGGSTHQNDNLALYFDLDNVTTSGTYATGDNFVIIADHRGEVADYSGRLNLDINVASSPPGATAKTAAQDGGFDAEIRLERAYFKISQPFVAERVLGFDFGTTDGKGVNSDYSQLLIWGWKPNQACNGNQGGCSCVGDSPICNTRHFGSLRLVGPKP